MLLEEVLVLVEADRQEVKQVSEEKVMYIFSINGENQGNS